MWLKLLGFFTNKWALIGGGIGAAFLITGFLWLRLDAVSAERDKYEAQVESVEAELKAIKKHYENIIDSREFLRNQTGQDTGQEQQARDETNSATQSDNGPIAPVMRRALECMWNNDENDSCSASNS